MERVYIDRALARRGVPRSIQGAVRPGLPARSSFHLGAATAVALRDGLLTPTAQAVALAVGGGCWLLAAALGDGAGAILFAAGVPALGAIPLSARAWGPTVGRSGHGWR